MMLDTDFSDRVVLVTGAAHGIGGEIARSFVEANADVYLADIDEDGVKQASDELGADYFCLDLSDENATSEMIGTIHEHHGNLHILVHAAGGVCGQVGQAIEMVSMDDWRVIFEANVDSAFCLARAAAPRMRENGFGRIINISSGAGLRPSLTGIQAYAAAKHALVGLTRQLSLELGSFGITVNSVAPGLILSNPSTQRQWDSYSDDVQQGILEAIHTKRLGKPEDIAAAVLYFASDGANWVTGQVLSVDGGRS